MKLYGKQTQELAEKKCLTSAYPSSRINPKQNTQTGPYANIVLSKFNQA